MPIKIITDSTANITADQIDGIDHVTVPLSTAPNFLNVPLL